MAVHTRFVSQSPSVARAVRWTRENLFSNIPNSAVTVAVIAFLYLVLFGSDPAGHAGALVTFNWPDLLGSGLIKFVFDGADWGVVHANRRLYFLFRFPSATPTAANPDETWRVWVILYVLSGLAGASAGLWTRISWRTAVVFALLMLPIFSFIGLGPVFEAFSDIWWPNFIVRSLYELATNGDVAMLTAGTIGIFTIGYLAVHLAPGRASYLAPSRSVAIGAWIAAFLLTMYLLNGVESRLWGGLLLTLIVTIFGIVASFPFGVLLALGRASTFPVIKGFCTAYIELMRAVPLITIFFMALIFLPLILEPDRRIFGVPITGIELDVVQRGMVAITAFSAAYIAENVRGGLQSVPRGQVEAAEALGLGTLRILGLIVLPQAIRAVLPSLVGQFISLFKDTSLLFIMAVTELLAVGKIVTNQPAFFGTQAESLLFVALIYWIIAFSMSQASQRLERTLGVGER